MAFPTRSPHPLATPAPPSPEPSPDTAATPSPAPATAPATAPGDPFAPMAAALWPHLEPRVQQTQTRGGGSSRYVVTLPESHSFQFPEGERPHAYFPLALAIAAQGVNLYIWSGAGTGKSHLAGDIARALGREYEVDSFSAQTTEARILGFVDAQGQPVITPLARAYEHGKIFVADEVDAGSAPTVAMNRALANGHATMANRLLTRHPDFLCIATGNTRGSGQADGFRREPLDAALLDRFFMMELPQDRGLERFLSGLPESPKFPSPTLDLSRGGLLDPEGWYQFLNRAREAADTLQIRATFKTSRRPVEMGCKLAAAGIGKYWLAQGLIRRSLSVNDWDKLAQALDVEP